MTLQSAIGANPFYQPARQWQISLDVKREHTGAAEEAFADIALSSSSFELTEDGEDWRVDILTATPPAEADIPARLALLSGLLEIAQPACELRELTPHDWVSEVERSFPPLHVGRFYVHGSHVGEPPPYGSLRLLVNAGAAFGSGEHATTSGCLMALTQLARRRAFRNTLDMGCGSGILALAMAKLWRRPVCATDIDPVSVATSRENARKNGIAALLRAEAADGYRAALVRRHGAFDLITANILARPLARMAPQLNDALAPGGIAVLSGLLATQERLVMAAHEAQGLRLVKRIPIRGWHTLIIRKGA